MRNTYTKYAKKKYFKEGKEKPLYFLGVLEIMCVDLS